VLRIRDVYPGSECFPSRVPDPGSAFASKNLSILNKKISEIFIPDLDILSIPDPGSRGQKGTGSATLLVLRIFIFVSRRKDTDRKKK
jgi:hypothetical protein